MPAIRNDEVEYSYPWTMDDVGRVFRWNGNIYRGIYEQAVPQVRDLFASGCLDELVERGLFPRSRIAEFTLDGFAAVVEHETLPFVTYPHEWSFDMFRSAALAVLEISEIAVRYGWRLKDCHPYNILFNGTKPVYVDMGSFVPAAGDAAFGPGDEFLACYWRPLSIWAAGDSFLAQRITTSAFQSMPNLSWQLYQNLLIRNFGLRWGQRLNRKWDKILRKGSRILGKSGAIDHTSCPLAARLPIEFLARNHNILRRKIARLRCPSPTSSWHDYQAEHFQSAGLTTTPRFDRLIEIVRSLNSQSVVELAGNNGLTSLLLATKTQVCRVVCTDYDSTAINQLYLYCRDRCLVPKGKTILPAVVNFMVPEVSCVSTPPEQRFRADLVTALAIVHHLTLTQNFPLREVIRAIARYTRRYALVEFMPLGLWDGNQAPPVPAWYNLAWFQKGFREFFEVLCVEETAPNRVLHLGRLKGVS